MNDVTEPQQSRWSVGGLFSALFSETERVAPTGALYWVVATLSLGGLMLARRRRV